ncbi:unnamed protein product [Paramecium sonneborni]|uniref:Uncharacterized protein n=1 Tax=Paramecium sonneborni TaxID=65129 RepID=A0A8S1RUW7_9CILI|nr:unnamed protein product [Paramecium sonneborni]
MKQIACLKHDLSYLLFIKQEAKYICEQCCLEFNEQQYIQFEWQKLIVINKALQSPEHLTSKLGLPFSLYVFFCDLDKLDDKAMNSLLINSQSQFQNIEKAA